MNMILLLISIQLNNLMKQFINIIALTNMNKITKITKINLIKFLITYIDHYPQVRFITLINQYLLPLSADLIMIKSGLINILEE